MRPGLQLQPLSFLHKAKAEIIDKKVTADIFSSLAVPR